MRIRCIKPEFWTDSLIVSLPRDVRLLYIGLWNVADDHGWIPDDPHQIRMLLFPSDLDADIGSWIDLLVACGRLERFKTPEGKWVLHILHWKDHQRVDHPSASKIAREGSRKLAIPLHVRREVAKKYKCPPGGRVKAACFFCGSPGEVLWFKLSSGKPSSWVVFPDLELDHFVPEASGGEGVADNLVLSCRSCNRSRCDASAFDYLASLSGVLANPLEGSLPIRDQGSGNGEEGKGKEQEASSRILDFLNLKTGSRFRAVDSHVRIIEARLSEPGVDEAGILKMIERQVLKWKNDPKMSEFLRPQTLFGKEKFQSYYDQRELPVQHGAGCNGSGRPTVADERNRYIGGQDTWEATSGKRALEEGEGFGIG